MDKRYFKMTPSEAIWNETLHCGNFKPARLKITIIGTGLDAEDQHWRFHEADNGRTWNPIGAAPFPIVNGVTTFEIWNPMHDLMLFRNPIGGLTSGHWEMMIEPAV